MKNKFFKRIISGIISCIFIISMCSTVIAEEKVNWDDVKNYYPFSKWAVDVGMKYDLIFMENNSRETKRHEVASIIYNIIDSKKLNQSNINFNDIGQLDDKTKNIIENVAASNILKGYEDGTFKPFNSVTRAEFVTILDRSDILKDKNTSNNITFADIKGHWAKDSITKIANLGIVNGKSESSFCPEDTITPQEILVILDRLVNMGTVSKSQLIEAMTTTFKCKVYSDKENFITEKIYGNYDEIQNKVIYTWPYEEYYDPSNGIELATCKNIQNAIYFSITRQTYLPREDDKDYWDIYNDIKKDIYAAKGLDINNESNANKTATIRDLIIAMKHIIEGEIKFEDTDDFSDTGEGIKFINKNEFTREEVVSINALLDGMDDKNHYIKNENIYLPLEAPITKVILNYFISNFRNVWCWQRDILYDWQLELETNPSKLPSNYYEYPFIIKGIPKYVYEKDVVHLGREGGNFNAKISYLRKFGEDTGKIAKRVTDFYNTMVNVDYSSNSIFFNEYKRVLLSNSNLVSEEDIDKYIEYVKSNQIILKGKAKAIPGTIVVYEPFAYIRVMLDFEIVSAKDNKNVLLLDFKNLKGADIIYEKNNYSLVLDVPIQGFTYESEGKLKYGYYSAMQTVIYECLYPMNEEYIMR